MKNEFYREHTLFILGASDPEMEKIQTHLKGVDLFLNGKTLVARDATGKPVHPANAYKADRMATLAGETPGENQHYVFVECSFPLLDGERATIIDHHNPGDPGFGKSPENFLGASSLGQILSWLAIQYPEIAHWAPDNEEMEIPVSPGEFFHHGGKWWIANDEAFAQAIHEEIIMAAAADHCLGSAYQGKCPGVEPEDLMIWRARSRAKFQGVEVEQILSRVNAAQMELKNAPKYDLGGGILVADMRREVPVAELPEAATRIGAGYISGPLNSPDGRKKFTVSGNAEEVSAFMRNNPLDLDGIYGDPARGFAGGYQKT